MKRIFILLLAAALLVSCAAADPVTSYRDVQDLLLAAAYKVKPFDAVLSGTVHAVDDDGSVYVELDVPYKDPATGEEKSVVRFTRDMAKALRYAYALTVHKSQGSQYRKVVMVILARDKFQLDRSLIYTGVTRTRVECVIVGDYSAFASGITATRKKDTCLQCFALEDIFNQKGIENG